MMQKLLSMSLKFLHLMIVPRDDFFFNIVIESILQKPSSHAFGHNRPQIDINGLRMDKNDRIYENGHRYG
jgi:hypothetical protein